MPAWFPDLRWTLRFVGALLVLCPPLAAIAEPPPSKLTLRFKRIKMEHAPVEATDIAFLPGKREFLVATTKGVVSHYKSGMDFSGRKLGQFQVPNHWYGIQCSNSLAIDPDFERNKLFYVSYCTSKEYARIVRFRLEDDYAAIPQTAATILEVGDKRTVLPFHNIGSIGFDATGVMWALIGDKHLYVAQQLDHNLGKLVRILPNRESREGGYAPDPRNPFYGQKGRSADIYAFGLRSPWRGALDERGFYWVGDVGQDNVEEINLVTGPGQNFGWPTWEGPCLKNCARLTQPLVHVRHVKNGRYAREDPAKNRGPGSIYVALHYPHLEDDPYQGRLAGATIIGEHYAGWIRELRVDETGKLVRDRHLGHLEDATAWAIETRGYILAAVFQYGQPSHFYVALPHGLAPAAPKPAAPRQAEPAPKESGSGPMVGGQPAPNTGVPVGD